MKAQPVAVYSLDGRRIDVCVSMRAAARKYGISIGNVADCCNFARRSARNLTFRCTVSTREMVYS